MKQNSKKEIRVGILRGGQAPHYHSSLKRGGEILLHIQKNLTPTYKPVDIFIDKDHVWHIQGVPISPSELPHKIDLAWNISHPSFTSVLESLSIPHIESGSFSLVLEGNNEMLRKHVESIGVQMPRSVLLPSFQEDFDGPRERYAIKKAKEIFEKFGAPWIVKSFSPESNTDLSLAKTFGELAQAIEDRVKEGKSIVVEEFISGKIAPVHSLTSFRGEDVYVFPPGNFSSTEKEKLISTAKDLHKHINVRNYLKSNFVLNPRGRVYLLGVELTPDLREDSHFHQACVSVGTKMHNVVEHILGKVRS